MGDYRDNHRSHSDEDSGAEEDLGHLEDGHEDGRESERERPRGRVTDPRELPRPLYRLKATHSNETFYAYFPQDKKKTGQVQELDSNEITATESPVQDSAPEAPSEAHDQGAVALVTAEPLAEGEAAAEANAVSPQLLSRTMVVVPTRYGRDVCELQGVVNDPGQVGRDEIVAIERIATDDDLRKVEANREREKKAFETCKQKIAARNLPMKLVSAHYLLEEPKVLFYFSAESRVDFRELVKDLVAVFKIRIELRQIGVRDEARVTGGCGVCGRVLCCHGVTDKLVPVSIKMAKDQNLSLNSMKISGPCGRLLRCLAYEDGFYRDARRELPSEGARFQYDGVLFRVIEVNALSGSVKMSGEDGRLLDMPAARFTHAEGRWQVLDEPEDEEKEKEKGKGKDTE
jgi:cell fate regulator YaaT (PSP1 superfamily)